MILLQVNTRYSIQYKGQKGADGTYKRKKIQSKLSNEFHVI